MVHVNAMNLGSCFNEWPVEKVSVVCDKHCRLYFLNVVEESSQAIFLFVFKINWWSEFLL